MSTEETPVPGLDDEREQLPPMPPGWMPVSEAGAAAIHRHFNDVWLPVFLELAELDTAGALGGIRAIIAERLRQVRSGHAHLDQWGDMAMTVQDGYARSAHAELGALLAGNSQASPAVAAALLAAEIDRLAGDRS